MSQTIGIRYRTPAGTVGTWKILRSAPGLRGDDDASLKSYLAYWHPDYVYLGRDGQEAPKMEPPAPYLRTSDDKDAT